jgi:hypothetical protein
VMYRKRGRKLEYYNTATSDWTEVGTDIFPAAAANDEMTFANYALPLEERLFANIGEQAVL